MSRTERALTAHVMLRAEEQRMETAVDNGVSSRGLYALCAIAKSPMSSGELSRRLLIEPSSLTFLSSRLEEKGLLRKTKGDDHRKILLELTHAGRKLLDRVDSCAAAEWDSDGEYFLVSDPTARASAAFALADLKQCVGSRLQESFPDLQRQVIDGQVPLATVFRLRCAIVLIPPREFASAERMFQAGQAVRHFCAAIGAATAADQQLSLAECERRFGEDVARQRACRPTAPSQGKLQVPRRRGRVRFAATKSYSADLGS